MVELEYEKKKHFNATKASAEVGINSHIVCSASAHVHTDVSMVTNLPHVELFPQNLLMTEM